MTVEVVVVASVVVGSSVVVVSFTSASVVVIVDAAVVDELSANAEATRRRAKKTAGCHRTITVKARGYCM